MSNTATKKLDYCCSSLKLAMDMGGIQLKFVNGLGMRYIKYVLLFDDPATENVALFKEGIIEKQFKKDKIETSIIKPIAITGYKFLLDILEYCNFCGKKLVNKTINQKIAEITEENRKIDQTKLKKD